MNRKIVIIIAALICLCAALITAQHFANKDPENTTEPTTLSETPQTAAPSENPEKESQTSENTSAHSDKNENTKQTEKSSQKATETSSKNGGAKESTSSGSKPTETKPQSTKAPSSEKASFAATTKKPQSNTTTTKPNTTTEATTKAEKQTVTVTISINCEKALAYGKDVPESGYFLTPCKFTANKGATVFDVLEAVAKENGITLKYQSKAYIQAINGLAEKDCGGGSGWTYKVNGVKPNKSAAKYEPADGDVIEWYYVTSPND